MRVQCNTCKGEYDTMTADGLTYYHVCPPVTAVRATRQDGSKALVAIEKLSPVDTIRVRRGDAIVETQVSAILPDDVRVDELTLPRPNTRDERPNVQGTTTIGMISTGKGITPVAAPTATKTDPVIL